MYYQTADTFGLTFDQVRRLFPQTSFREGLPVDMPEKGLKSYAPAPTPQYNPATHAVREVAPVDGVQQWEVYPLPADEVAANFAAAREAAWNRIKAERDRRKFAGVKVGAHWFHSDDSSRIQQLALVMMGASIPTGLQWKTLTLSPPPVFVTMTPSLAGHIFQATAAQDAAIFAAAEAHRIAMEASADPQGYDWTTDWPDTIEDDQ